MPSIKAASDDLHLLLQDPDRFLFDRSISGGVTSSSSGSSVANMLDIKQNKLYGREREQLIITDIFCRVSMTGVSEALFIKVRSFLDSAITVHSLYDMSMHIL